MRKCEQMNYVQKHDTSIMVATVSARLAMQGDMKEATRPEKHAELNSHDKDSVVSVPNSASSSDVYRTNRRPRKSRVVANLGYRSRLLGEQ